MGREELIDTIRKLINSRVSKLVASRISGFKSVNRFSREAIMRELAYCILTANYRADRVIEIDSVWGYEIINLDLDSIRNILREFGYRYPNVRSKYIYMARGKLNEVLRLINSGMPTSKIRERLIDLIDGFGYKEASHFLRNIGFLDVAIIDRHILKILKRFGLVNDVSRLDGKTYLFLEGLLKDLADELGITPGELDLYLWYLSTGKILK